MPGVIGVGPFIINPMMVSHGDKTATGVLLKGVDPERMPQVLDLPRHIRAGLSRSAFGAQAPRLLRGRGTHSDRSAAPPFHRGCSRPAPAPDAAARPSVDRLAALSAATAQAAIRTLRDAAEVVDPRRFARPTPARTAPRRGAPSKRGSRSGRAERSRRDRPLPRKRAPRSNRSQTAATRASFPDDDILPDDVDPDPCSSPDAGQRRCPASSSASRSPKTSDVGIGDCVQVTSPTIGYSFPGAIRAARREAVSASSPSSRPASTSTTRSSSTPTSTRRRPSTIRATPSPASR